MPRPTAASARARTSQLIDNLWDYDMVNDNFEDASIPVSKITDWNGLSAGSIDGSVLTGLANIPVGAGVIPSANLPAASPGYFAVTGTSALTGNITTGNARGTNAIDISTKRLAVGNVASGSKSILIGQDSTASGDNSIVMGNTAQGTGSSSIAIGNVATILNSSTFAIAIGDHSKIGYGVYTGNKCVAIGYYAMAGVHPTGSRVGAIAIGASAQAAGNYSIAIGSVTAATAYQVKIGFGTNFLTIAGDTGLVTIPSLRVNTAPSASVATPSTHKVAVNFNGASYFILLSNV